MFGSGLDYHLGSLLHLELGWALFAGRWRRLGYGCCLASYALRRAMISETGVTGWPATYRLYARVTWLAAGELSAIVVSGIDCCIRGGTG
jgi:hypothetical protein